MARIKSITRKQITDEKLFNLAVEADESFIADGVVVHNCKSWLRPVLKGNVPKNEKVTPLRPPASAVKTIQFSEAALHCPTCGHGPKSGD